MSTPDAPDDGWTVARDRRNTRHQRRRQGVGSKPGAFHRYECPPDDTDPDKHPVSKLVPRLDKSVWYVKTLAKLERSLSGRSVSSLVCLGMGSMSIQKNARHQFACAILLARHFCLPPSSVVIYDPIMTPEDKSLVESFGYRVGTSELDFEARHENGALLLFMPHVHRKLTQDVVKYLRKRDELSNTVYLGNELKRTNPELSKRLATWFLNLVESDQVDEKPCGDGRDSTLAHAFNDLAVSSFLSVQ